MSQKRIYYKTAHQRVRLSPGPSKSKKVERKAANVEQYIMEEHQNPEEVAKSGQKHLEFATGDLKEAASAKIENIRQAAGQKADELRGVAQGKVEELRGAVQNAKSQAKSWQAEGEAYVRENPSKAVLVALGVGILLGLLLRK